MSIDKNAPTFLRSDKENNEFLSAIGRVTIEFSKLENEISGFIIILLGNDDPETGSIVISEIGFKQLKLILMSLYTYKVTDDTKRTILRSILKRSEALGRKRNNHVHAYWYSIESVDSVMYRKFKSHFKTGFQKEHKVVRVSEINALADKISAVRIELSRFAMKWFSGN